MKTIHFRTIVLAIASAMITTSGYSQSSDPVKDKKELTKKDTVINKDPHAVKNVFYTCPTHVKVRSDKAGSCPQCGVTMNKKIEKVYYACPKHAEVKHDDKGQCEKCGVVLEQKE